MKSSQYVVLFVDEASMLLQQCHSCLEQLELNLEDEELYRELFRLIHTIKGMASTLVDEPYFEDITQLSHCIETLLDTPTPQINAVQLYMIADAVHVLSDLVEVVAHPDQCAPVQQLEAVYRNFQSTQPILKASSLSEEREKELPQEMQALSPEEQTLLKSALEQKQSIFQLQVQLMSGCLMKSVRALLVIHNLESAGHILATQPNMEALREGHFSEEFSLYIQSEESSKDLQILAESVSEIESVNVSLYGPESVPRKASPVKEKPETKAQPSNSNAPPVLNEFEKHVLQEAGKQKLNAVWLRFHVTRKLSLLSARIALIFRHLENRGEVIKTVPEVQQLETEQFNQNFSLLLISSENPETLKVNLNKEPEIQACFQVDSYLHGESPPALPSFHQPTPLEATVYIGAAMGDIRTQVPLTTIPPEARKSKDHTESERLRNIRLQHLVRVDADQLKQLNELTGQLLMTRARLNQVSRPNQHLKEAISSLNRVTASLQSVSMQLQTITASQVFNRYPRMVRDLSRSLGKEIRCELNGEQVEIDRAYVDDLSSILLHMIRNAADHGLETTEERYRLGKNPQGTLTISASYRDREVCIEVADDGRGIDVESLKHKAIESGIISVKEADYMTYQEAMELIFRPGLSTSLSTTDISGRGVGMDVVLNHVRQIGGQLYIHSRAGQGTRFTILLPSDLKQIQSVLVRVAQQFFALPLEKVQQICLVDELPSKSDVISLHNLRLINGELKKHPSDATVLYIESNQQQFWLLADELLGYQQLAVKSLPEPDGHDIVQGAAMLDPHNLALYLDPDKIRQLV